jgi:hypothetical protein
VTTDNLITANHAKAWDAKLLAYVLPRQNTVAGLPGGFTSPITSSGTASAKTALVLLEDDTMLNYLLAATILAVLAFGPMSLAQTADGETPDEEQVCDDLKRRSGFRAALCIESLLGSAQTAAQFWRHGWVMPEPRCRKCLQF